MLAVPTVARTLSGSNASLKITGASGFTTINNALTTIAGQRFSAVVTLPQPVTPLPISVIAQLQKIIDSAPGATPGTGRSRAAGPGRG